MSYYKVWPTKFFNGEYGTTWMKRRTRKNDYNRKIYSQESINSIVFSVSFKQVLIDYIVLRKRGKDLVGRCPFCKPITANDKHFVFNENKRIFKCFECGYSGRNAVYFLQLYYKIPFHTALEALNRIYVNKPLMPERIGLVKKEAHIDENLPF